MPTTAYAVTVTPPEIGGFYAPVEVRFEHAAAPAAEPNPNPAYLVRDGSTPLQGRQLINDATTFYFPAATAVLLTTWANGDDASKQSVTPAAYATPTAVTLQPSSSGTPGTSLSSRYLPFSGVRIVPFGDSTVIANSDSQIWGNRDIFAWAHVLSGGASRYVANAGVGGDDAGEALVRFDTAVTPNAPDVVPIVLGINDAVNGRTVAAYAADIRSIVAKCKAISAMPILFTVAPNTNTGAVQQRIADLNDWLRNYTAAEGLPLVDTNTLLTDPSTGSYLSAYDLDGTHQNEAGAKVMAAAFNTVLARYIPVWSPPLATSNTSDQNNLVTNGLFLTNTGGLGTGWSKTGGTASIVSGSTPVKGNWQRLTDAAVEVANIRQNITLAPTEVGDVLEFSGRVITVNGTSTASVQLFFNCSSSSGGVTYIINAATLDVDGQFTRRLTVLPGTTALQVQLARTCTVLGNGYSQIAQVTVRNLTKRSILTA